MRQDIENLYYLRTDASFHIQSINLEWKKAFSKDFISLEDNLKNYFSIAGMKELEKQVEASRKENKSGFQIELPLKGLNQVVHWFRWIVSIENEILHFYALDISAWKFAENHAKASEEFLNMGAWSINLADMSTRWSQKTYKIHGENPETPTNVENGISYFLPEFRAMIEEKVSEAIEKSKAFEFEARIQRPDGQIRWVRSYGLCEKFNNETASVFGLIEDIQKNKEEKKDLKVSKEQLESVAQNLPGILYTFFMKPCGEVGFSYMTEKAQEIYGFRADEIIANPSITFENIHPNDLPDLNLAIADSAKNMTEFQWMGRVLNGSKTKWIKAVSTPYKKSNGMIEWRGIMLDVTKEKEREELIEFHQAQLFASRKFSDLGEVAGGIAHEINTPLATLGLSIDHIENLKKRNQLNEIHLTKTLDSMRRVVDRLARIVDTIRNFSRDKVGEPMVHTTWNELTQEALNLVREKLKQLDIDVDLDIDESLIINCRYNQTLQAFLNLVKNSIDALEKDNNYPKSISIRTSSNPQNVYLEVVDSGPGVPGKIKDRVFDSFFTTKSYGRGTGLGLSLSREFIESSGGQLELHKQNKRYNCFRISFPSVLFQEVS